MMGLFGVFISLAGIGASELQHKAQLAKKREAYMDSIGCGYDFGFEYLAACYYNQRYDEYIKKYEEQYGHDAAAQMAEFELLGFHTEYPQAMIFARRIIWVRNGIPSNMASRQRVSGGEIAPQPFLPEEDWIRSTSLPLFKYTDSEPDKWHYYHAMDWMGKYPYRPKTLWKYGVAEEFKQLSDAIVESTFRRVKDSVGVIDRNRISKVYDITRGIRALYGTRNFFHTKENGLRDMMTKLKAFRDEEQYGYDILPEHLQQTERAMKRLDNVAVCDQALKKLKGILPNITAVDANQKMEEVVSLIHNGIH